MTIISRRDPIVVAPPGSGRTYSIVPLTFRARAAMKADLVRETGLSADEVLDALVARPFVHVHSLEQLEVDPEKSASADEQRMEHDEQKQLLANVGDKVFEQRKALIGQTTDPRAEVKSLIAGPKFDAAKAQTLINDKAGALQTKSPEVVAALAAFYDSLNVTQQQKVRDFMEGRHGWFSRS